VLAYNLGYLWRRLASPKKNSALESLEGCIVWGCWELKRKFRIKHKCNFNDRAVVVGDDTAF